MVIIHLVFSNTIMSQKRYRTPDSVLCTILKESQRADNTHHGFRISSDGKHQRSKWSATCVATVTTNVVLG